MAFQKAFPTPGLNVHNLTNFLSSWCPSSSSFVIYFQLPIIIFKNYFNFLIPLYIFRICGVFVNNFLRGFTNNNNIIIIIIITLTFQLNPSHLSIYFNSGMEQMGYAFHITLTSLCINHMVYALTMVNNFS